jgi:hypothetical protein
MSRKMSNSAQTRGKWSASVETGLRRHARKSSVAGSGMVKRIAPVGVLSLILVAACGAVCQNAGQSLPDAPSKQTATQEQNFNVFILEAPSFSKSSALGIDVVLMHRGGFAAFNEPVSGQAGSNTIMGRYLQPPAPNQQLRYQTSSSGSMMGRATYAASRIFVTRDDSGKGRLNTSYLLRALTSVAAATASRPYWRRPMGAPFSDFGSTVGNDAGMNLWHEFGPGIQQLMKSHTPKSVSKIEERIGHK